MAVVQISRIQHRRGRKNQGSGLPQLASGELGWAVDTQELYIGNGSVAEGAPFVGNTQILTENTNLFEYAATYSYKSDDANIVTGPSVNSPIQRTLQERLDDIVSLRAFGATGDNLDHTLILKRAINQLFLNSANKALPKSRVILWIEPGEYKITNTIYLPPNVNIRGAGKDKTVINSTVEGPVFVTINSSNTPSSPIDLSTSTTLNQASNIFIDGLTMNIPENGSAFLLESCKDSVFSNIKINGSWENLDSLSIGNFGIRLNALSGAVTSQNNLFENIDISGFSYGVASDFDVHGNRWEQCSFENVGIGVEFGSGTVLGLPGQDIGPYNNTISNSIFRDIDRQGIRVEEGAQNLSDTNRFYSVGNNGASDSNPVYAVIQFDSATNLSENDWFERTEKLSFDPTYLVNVPYIPNVQGPVIYQDNYTYSLDIGEYGEYTKFLKLPADEVKGFEIDYTYTSTNNDAARKGTLDIIVDPARNTNGISDSYEFIGDTLLETSLSFTVQNYDENGDGTVDTIALMVLNSTSGDNAKFNFRIKTKS